MISVHGHAGRTVVRWLDQVASFEAEYAMS
jgi:hypothetical protein